MPQSLSFDDPKPTVEKRKQQLIYLLPSLRDRIDRERGSVSRSVWIERAIRAAIARAAAR